MEKALKEKLEAVVELVNKVMVNPDIEVVCCRAEGATTSRLVILIYTLNIMLMEHI